MLCLRDFELYSRWVPLKFAYTVRAVIGLHEALNRRQFKEYYGFSALPIKFNIMQERQRGKPSR